MDDDSPALAIECPLCHAPVDYPCTNVTTGELMGWPHEARRIVALDRDGEIGGLAEDDPDLDIAPLGDDTSTSTRVLKPPAKKEPPAPVSPAGSTWWGFDNFADRDVLRWAQNFGGETTYIYAAIKADGVGWFLSGKTVDALTWDELWNKHLSKALWVQKAESWSPHLILPHTAKGPS